MKKYFPIILFIMGFTGFLCGQVAFDLFDQAKREKMVHPKVAKTYEILFSEMSFNTVNGKEIKLDEVAAPIVILNFWASWCSPCLEEFPSMVELRTNFKEKDVLIIGINGDEENSLKEIKKVIRKYKINFPTVTDPSGEILSKFNVSSIPLTIIFHRGKVLEVVKGPKDFSAVEMQQNFKELLEREKAVVKAN